MPTFECSLHAKAWGQKQLLAVNDESPYLTSMLIFVHRSAASGVLVQCILLVSVADLRAFALHLSDFLSASRRLSTSTLDLIENGQTLPPSSDMGMLSGCTGIMHLMPCRRMALCQMGQQGSCQSAVARLSQAPVAAMQVCASTYFKVPIMQSVASMSFLRLQQALQTMQFSQQSFIHKQCFKGRLL